MQKKNLHLSHVGAQSTNFDIINPGKPNTYTSKAITTKNAGKSNDRIAGISSFYEQGHKGRKVCPEYHGAVKAHMKAAGK